MVRIPNPTMFPCKGWDARSSDHSSHSRRIVKEREIREKLKKEKEEVRG